MKKLNYYTFITIRKIARKTKKFNLVKPNLKIAYASEFPRVDIFNLLEWYLPKDRQCIQLELTKCTDFNSFDLILYDYPLIKFSIPLLQNIEKIAPISPTYYSISEISNWSSLYAMTLSRRKIEEYKRQFKNNLFILKDNIENTQCWLFGSGPSIEIYSDLKIKENSFKIICNSIIKNKEFCRTIKPNVIACADPVFHFGHSKYAQQFRKDLIQGMKDLDLTVIMPSHHAYLFVQQYPEFKHKVIGVELSNQFNLDLSKDLCVKSTDNILSLLLLPLASTFSKDVHLIGFDGKSPEQFDYFWKHHSNFQYVSLMEDVKKEHPSFFSDRNYSTYSKSHEKTIKYIFNKFEALGIQVKSHAKSYIPSINAKR